MCFSSVCYIPIAGIAVLAATTNAKILYGSSASSFWLPMLRIEPALPMQSMLPALPMLKIEPALPMLRIEPALPMLRIEPALPILKMLKKLLILGKLPRLPMLIPPERSLRFRPERLLPYIHAPLCARYLFYSVLPNQRNTAADRAQRSTLSNGATSTLALIRARLDPATCRPE
jgi:hypothetical protein